MNAAFAPRVCHFCGQGFSTQKPLSVHLWHCSQHVTGKSKNRGRNNLLEHDNKSLMRSYKKRPFPANDTNKHPDGLQPISYTCKRSKICDSSDNFDEESIPETQSETHGYFVGELDVEHAGGRLRTEVGNTEPESDSQLSKNDCPSSEDLPMHHPRRSPASQSQPPFNSDIAVPPNWGFQIDLADILGRHRTDLKLYDEIIDLIKCHSHGRQLGFSSDNLMHRHSFLKKLEKALGSDALKPKDVTVQLSNKTSATVSVFDLEAMILSLLQDETLMRDENIAEGCDYFTGRSKETSNLCGEVHTGESWERARNYFCGDIEKNMPIALIVFGDKSHLDLHGSLSTIPLTFTLSCFNREARARTEFWRPFAYIPNLNHGDQQVSASASVSDEHACLTAALDSLVRISKNGGIAMELGGRSVVGKVWIHYVIGDCVGNNRWAGHYQHGKNCPYRDCFCPQWDMRNPNPACIYVSHIDVEGARFKKAMTRSKAAGKLIMQKMSKHDITNAFMRDGIALSDPEYGIYRMLPPELLHTTQEGVTKYMLSTFSSIIGKKSIKKIFENVHRKFHQLSRRNSERDLPHSAARTGFLKCTLVCAYERRGNLFVLLCISYTATVRAVLKPITEDMGCSIADFQDCLKLYLSMESWFHDSNPMEEVKHARPLIATTIAKVQRIFNCKEGRRWSLQKIHGLTKMQYYMRLFGSGFNFFGGPGEASHKKFVKDTGNNTQMRIDSFVSQCAQRYYETLILDLAKIASDKIKHHGYEHVETCTTRTSDNAMLGKFSINYAHGKIRCRWMKTDKSRHKCSVHHKFEKLSPSISSPSLVVNQSASPVTTAVVCYATTELRFFGRHHSI